MRRGSKKLKLIGFVLLGALVLSCSDSPSSGKGNYPVGAIVTPYEDIPNRERVVLRAGLKVIAEGDYYQGQQDGIWAEYDSESGHLRSITNYFRGKKQGPAMTFDDRTTYLSTKAFYNQDVLEGQYLRFDGLKKAEEKNYKLGKLNGMVRKYYRNGQVLEEAPYIDGLIHGVAKWYDEEGNLTIQYEYEDGAFVADITPKPE